MSSPAQSIELHNESILEKLKEHKGKIGLVLGLIALGVVGYVLYSKFYKKKNPVDCQISDNWEWDSCNCDNPDSSNMGYTIGHRNIIQQASDGGRSCPDPTSDELFSRKSCSCGGRVSTNTTAPGSSGNGGRVSTNTTAPGSSGNGGRVSTNTTAPGSSGNGGRVSTNTTAPGSSGNGGRVSTNTTAPGTTITKMPPTPLTSFPNDGDIIIIELVNSSLPSNIFLYSPDNTNLTGSSTPSAFKVKKSGQGFLFNLVGSNRYLTTPDFSTNGILSENAGVYNIIKEVYFEMSREQIGYPYPLPFGLIYDNEPVLDFKFWKLNY